MTKSIVVDKVLRNVFLAFLLCYLIIARKEVSLSYYFICWGVSSLLLTVFNFLRSDKYLMEYTIDKSQLTVKCKNNLSPKLETLRINLGDAEIQKYSTKEFLSPFNKLKFKYPTGDNLYKSVSLKVKNDKDWLNILNEINNKANHNDDE